MALTPTEEAQTRALIAQEAPLLSLASEEPAIISNLGATDVSLSDLAPAASLSGTDLLLVRQGATDVSGTVAQVTSAAVEAVPDATDTVKGKVSLAVAANYPSSSDAEAATPAYLALGRAGVVGASRNVKMSVTAASASATITADEVVLETALGGASYKLASFSKAINLATTGVGGMDTGSAPNNGYVGIYAIYNPATQTSALLAANATSAVAPEVYGGINMPAGYTASALVSVWATDASGQLKAGFQRGRIINCASTQVLNTATTQASLTALSISSVVPINAKAVDGTVGIGCNAATAITLVVSGEVFSGSIGATNQATIGATAGSSSTISFRSLIISAPQTIYYRSSNTSGTPNFNISITGYEF